MVGTPLEHLVQVSRYAAAMLEGFRFGTGCGSSGRYGSCFGMILLFRACRSPRLVWKRSHDPRSSRAHSRFVATQWLERQDAGRSSACGAIVMCAFWLRARSNHRGTNICVAIFSIRRNESRWSPSTLRISFYGVRFFFEHVLPRDWMSLALLDTRGQRSRPVEAATVAAGSSLTCAEKV